MGTPWLFTTPATTGTGDGATDAVAAFSKPGASAKYRAAATASATVGKATRTMVFRFICHLPYAGELGQQPGTIVVPPEPDLACLVVEPSGNVPVTGHGGVAVIDGGLPIVDSGAVVDGTMGDMNIVETGGGGLSPALPISVDPNGMPARPACNVDRVGIDEPALAAPPLPVPALPVPAQALDPVPAMPPPSNRGLAVCDVDPAAPVQPGMPMVESGAGLVPGAVISVAPSGMPVGATGEPEPMARGDAAPSGEAPVPLTCAKVEPQPRNAAARAAIANCIFMVSTFL